jgi:hypothetical protein
LAGYCHFVIRRRGVPCLHASAVTLGNHAIALMGPAGAGKSTTAAILALQGYSVVTEDLSPILEENGDLLVQPGYSYIRLWPSSVAFLFGSPNALPQLAPPWDKRYFDLPRNGCRVQQRPLPLGAVYLLSERCDDPSAPRIEPISAAEAFMDMVGNTYGNYLLDQTLRGQEFEFLSRLVTRIPLRRVIPHTDPSRLARLGKVIVNDFQALVPEAAGRL